MKSAMLFAYILHTLPYTLNSPYITYSTEYNGNTAKTVVLLKDINKEMSMFGTDVILFLNYF